MLLVVGLIVADRRVPDRAVGDRGPDPGRLQSRASAGSGRSGEHDGRDHRPGRPVDLRAPDGTADLRGGPGRADLRVLGPAHRRVSSSCIVVLLLVVLGLIELIGRPPAQAEIAGQHLTATASAPGPAAAGVRGRRSGVLIQAAGLALLAALSPTALLVAAVYLGSARPGLTTMFYLAGAVVMSLVMGVIVLLVAAQRQPAAVPQSTRPATACGSAWASCCWRRPSWSRGARPGRPIRPRRSRGSCRRMVADPAPLSAFVVGILIFAPGVTFLAALQVIATAQASLDLTALALIIVVVINVLLVWLPIAAAPGRPRG